MQIILHPSPRCTRQPSSPPSNLPSSTSHPVGSSAPSLLCRIPQHSTLPLSQIEIYCTKAWMQRGFPAPFSIQRLVVQAQNSRGKGRIPALPTKGTLCGGGRAVPDIPLASPPVPLGHLTLSLFQLSREDLFHKDLFLTTASLGAGWVSGNSSFQRLGLLPGWGHSSGGGRGPAGPL